MLSVATYRALCVAGVLALCIWREQVDLAITSIWSLCKSSSLFRHDSWEPSCVVVSWSLITAFWCVQIGHGHSLLRVLRAQSDAVFAVPSSRHATPAVRSNG